MPTTDEEQLLLELVNAARLDPLGNASSYISSFNPLSSNNPDVAEALSYFGVNGADLEQQLAALTPADPLASDDILIGTATAHSTLMSADGSQSHQLPGEADLGTRVTAAGYQWNAVGENIYAYATSPLDAQAAFMVDWGGSAADGGMQSPPGHRENIMSTNYREIGVGIVDSGANGLGPEVTTEDFGSRGSTGVFLLGVAYDDTDNNNFYSIGEGVAGLTVSVAGAAGISSSSGGYSLYTTATGAQTITLTGGGLASAVTDVVNFANGRNYKIDVISGHILHTSISGVISGPVDTVVGLGLTGLTLSVSGGNQTVIGTPANDTLSDGSGNDTLNGGGGIDTAAYSSAFKAYKITRNEDGTIAVNKGAQGTDKLIAISYASFADAQVRFHTASDDFDSDGYTATFTPTGQPYSSYAYEYSAGGVVIVKAFDYTNNPGQSYTKSEIDYDGGNHLLRQAYSGVTGASYSSYENDYVVGAYAGSKFNYTTVPAGAAYSSYTLETTQSGALSQADYFYTGITGQFYSNEEIDVRANQALARVVLSGVSGEPFTQLTYNYTALGALKDTDALYAGASGSGYATEDVDVSASGTLASVLYSDMTGSPYSSVQQFYTSGGAAARAVYDFTNVTGQSYYAYQVTESAAGAGLSETLDLKSGAHEEIALAGGQTLSSQGDDLMVGSTSGATTFSLTPIYGADTIANLTAADTVSMSSGEFKDFSTLFAAAINSAGNVLITAADGDRLTLDNMNKTTLASLSGNFTFG